MIIHSIISENDMFFLPEGYMQGFAHSEKDGKPKSNVVPCITDPAEFLKASNPIKYY